MVELEINETSVKVSEGSTVMEAAEKLGIFIPHFCYQDRKSTRLNSSHTVISYAVFCLKKKKQLN